MYASRSDPHTLTLTNAHTLRCAGPRTRCSSNSLIMVGVDNPAVACPKCRNALPWSSCNTREPTLCPICGVELYAAVFPAIGRNAEVQVGDVLLVHDESSCFYHPDKRAMTACELCGRFLCALCDVEIGGGHLCTACIETGKKKGKLRKLDGRRVLYDELALILALLPVIFVFPTLVTAPIALFLCIRHWNTPLTILPRTKFRYVLAGVFAAIQIVGWIVFFASRMMS